MKILIVSEFIGERYGQEKILAQLIPLLMEAGHEVAVLGSICEKKQSPLYPIYLEKNVFQIHFFTPRKKIKQILKRCNEILQEFQPDLVHLMDLPDYRVIRFFRKKIATIFTAHSVAATCPASSRYCSSLSSPNQVCKKKGSLSCFISSYQRGCLDHFSSSLSKAISVMSFLLKKKELQKTKMAIAISQYIYDTLIENGWAEKQVRLVYNPIFIPRLICNSFSSLPASSSSSCFSSSTQDYFLCASRLVPLKGIDTLIRAIPLAVTRGWCVKICGDGPQRNILFELAKKLNLLDQIEFLGQKTNSEIFSFLQNSLGLIQPNSGPEGFGLSVAEAVQAQVPIIYSNVPAFSEITRFALESYVFQAQDAKALAACLDLVFRKKQEERKKIRREKSFVDKKLDLPAYFSLEAHVKTILQVYDQTGGVLSKNQKA